MPHAHTQDVESYDPVLNPVLNREVRRTGGRVLITLGDQDIDLSPSFVIFLSTREPTVRPRAASHPHGDGAVMGRAVDVTTLTGWSVAPLGRSSSPLISAPG